MMSKQYLYMKEIVITDLQQGLLGNKCGSDNFIRGLSQANSNSMEIFPSPLPQSPFSSLPFLSLFPPPVAQW